MKRVRPTISSASSKRLKLSPQTHDKIQRLKPQLDLLKIKPSAIEVLASKGFFEEVTSDTLKLFWNLGIRSYEAYEQFIEQYGVELIKPIYNAYKLLDKNKHFEFSLFELAHMIKCHGIQFIEAIYAAETALVQMGFSKKNIILISGFPNGISILNAIKDHIRTLRKYNFDKDQIIALIESGVGERAIHLLSSEYLLLQPIFKLKLNLLIKLMKHPNVKVIVAFMKEYTEELNEQFDVIDDFISLIYSRDIKNAADIHQALLNRLGLADVVNNEDATIIYNEVADNEMVVVEPQSQKKLEEDALEALLQIHREPPESAEVSVLNLNETLVAHSEASSPSPLMIGGAQLLNADLEDAPPSEASAALFEDVCEEREAAAEVEDQKIQKNADENPIQVQRGEPSSGQLEASSVAMCSHRFFKAMLEPQQVGNTIDTGVSSSAERQNERDEHNKRVQEHIAMCELFHINGAPPYELDPEWVMMKISSTYRLFNKPSSRLATDVQESKTVMSVKGS